MSRVYGHLVMIVGCLISLVSFGLLPYLAVSYAAFTGLQLVTLGSLIPLPTPPRAGGYPPHFWLQNIPFVWGPPALVIMLLPAAVGDMVFTLTGMSVSKGATRMLLIVAGLTLCFALCSLVSNIAAGYPMMGVHRDTIEGIGSGTLFTPGFEGFMLGMVVALIGGMMTLWAKGHHLEMSNG